MGEERNIKDLSFGKLQRSELQQSNQNRSSHWWHAASTKWDVATVIESVRLKTVLQVQLPEGPKLYPCLNTFALIQTNHIEPIRLSTYLALSLAKNRLGKIKSTNRHRTKAAVPRTQCCHGCSHIHEPSNRTLTLIILTVHDWSHDLDHQKKSVGRKKIELQNTYPCCAVLGLPKNRGTNIYSKNEKTNKCWEESLKKKTKSEWLWCFFSVWQLPNLPNCTTVRWEASDCLDEIRCLTRWKGGTRPTKRIRSWHLEIP